MQQEISSQAKGEMDRSQREFFLRQQMKAIQSELGEGNELAEEIAQLRDKAQKAKMPKPVLEEVERQLKKLERMHPDSAETATLRNWLDWMVTLPWGKATKDNLDLAGGQEDPGRGPLRAGEGQGAHPRVPGGAQAQGQDEGAAALLRRPSGRGQDQPGPLHRARAGPQVRAPVAGRGEGRGRDPRPPPDLRGLHAGPHHPGHPPRGGQQSRVHDGRGGQDRGRLPRRPVAPPCSRSSIRSRTTASATTTWACPSTSRARCSSARPISPTPSRPPSSTAWRSSGSPATPKTRSSRSPSATSCPSSSRSTASPRSTW